MPLKADRIIAEAELVKQLAPLAPFCLYHFGSSTRAEGMRPESDIDLAFLSDQPKDPFDVFSVAQNIARLCHRDVDLVDLRKCGTVMAMRVMETGRKLFVSDPRAVAEFEMKVFSAYARLNEERRPVLAAQGVL